MNRRVTWHFHLAVEGFPLILRASFISCSLSDFIGKVITSVSPVSSYSVPSYLVSAAGLPILQPSIPDSSLPHPLISDKSDEVVLESISNRYSTVTFEPSGMTQIRFSQLQTMVYPDNALSCRHPDTFAKESSLSTGVTSSIFPLLSPARPCQPPPTDTVPSGSSYRHQPFIHQSVTANLTALCWSVPAAYVLKTNTFNLPDPPRFSSRVARSNVGPRQQGLSRGQENTGPITIELGVDAELHTLSAEVLDVERALAGKVRCTSTVCCKRHLSAYAGTNPTPLTYGTRGTPRRFCGSTIARRGCGGHTHLHPDALWPYICGLA